MRDDAPMNPIEQLFAGTFAAWVTILDGMRDTLVLVPGRYPGVRFTGAELSVIIDHIDALAEFFENKSEEWTDPPGDEE